MVRIYGIANCDTMKKALAWLEENGVAYEFHDYKKAGVDKARLMQWVKHLGWKSLLNTRGTTWRKLAPEQQADMTQARAVALMLEQPSLIKRPVVENGQQLLVGFEPQLYASFLPVGSRR